MQKTMEYWQKDIETMNREDLKKLQFERLRKTIEAAGNSPFYSKVFKENGITADSIQSLDDLQKIPFTTKDDPSQQLSVTAWRLFLSRTVSVPFVKRYYRKPNSRIAFGQRLGPMG